MARAAGVREATVALGAAELDSGAEPLALVDPGSRGDPMSPLRWTTKSTRKLAAELTRAIRDTLPLLNQHASAIPEPATTRIRTLADLHAYAARAATPAQEIKPAC